MRAPVLNRPNMRLHLAVTWEWTCWVPTLLGAIDVCNRAEEGKGYGGRSEVAYGNRG
jgi:hypothetical protein